MACGICGKAGHNRRTCPDTVGGPADGKGKSGNNLTSSSFSLKIGSLRDVRSVLNSILSTTTKSRLQNPTASTNKFSGNMSTCEASIRWRKAEDVLPSKLTVTSEACSQRGQNRYTFASKNLSSVGATNGKESKNSKRVNVVNTDKRRCGLCRNAGHDQRNCPQKKIDWLTDEAMDCLKKGMTEKDGTGYIYMYKKRSRDEVDMNWFKIGLSKDLPNRRIHQQEKANKEEYELLWSERTPCRGLTEKVIHKQLIDFHCPKSEGDGKTEWFMGYRDILTQKARKAIKECRMWYERQTMNEEEINYSFAFIANLA